MPEILVDEVASQITRVTLNRPEALNAFSPSMYPEFLRVIEEIGRTPEIRVVILTGAGRGFCSGHDGSATGERPWVPSEVGKLHRSLHFMKLLNTLGVALRNLPQPVIAAVNGPAAGIGYSLALSCDILLAAKSAKFVNAFHNAGTGSEVGLSYLLPRAVGTQRAAELLLNARALEAEEAERIGLVLKAVADDQLISEAVRIGNQMILNAPLDLWLTKQNMYANLDAGSLEQAIAFETRAVMMVNATTDIEEKRAARREKRVPTFHSK